MVAEIKSVRRGDSGQRILLQMKLTESVPEEFEVERSEPTYFGSRRRPYISDFYILDLHTGHFETLPRVVQDRDSKMCTMAAAVGSKVYIFGGPIRGDNNVSVSKNAEKLSYVLDLNNYETGGWKRVDPPLTFNQSHLHAGVEFAGKMYFFRDTPFSCLCEVLDTQLYQWRPIKSLPGAQQTHLHITPPVLADDKNERIMVLIRKLLYAYYPFKDEWELLVNDFFGWCSLEKPATIVDGVIYIHYRKIPGFFRAFDTATKQYLNVQVSIDNCESYLEEHHYPYLLHLGDGILCLLAHTYQDNGPDQSQTTLLHVGQFKVELVEKNGTKEVLVTPISSKYHHINSRCFVDNCLRI